MLALTAVVLELLELEPESGVVNGCDQRLLYGYVLEARKLLGYRATWLEARRAKPARFRPAAPRAHHVAPLLWAAIGCCLV